jgi:hypothetical protein
VPQVAADKLCLLNQREVETRELQSQLTLLKKQLESTGINLADLDAVLGQLVESKKSNAQLQTAMDMMRQQHRTELAHTKALTIPTKYRVDLPVTHLQDNSDYYAQSISAALRTQAQNLEIATVRAPDGALLLPSEIAPAYFQIPPFDPVSPIPGIGLQSKLYVGETTPSLVIPNLSSTPTPPSSSYTGPSTFVKPAVEKKLPLKAALKAYYLQVDPTKADEANLQDITKRYVGKEHILVNRLVDKYKVAFPAFDVGLSDDPPHVDHVMKVVSNSAQDVVEEERERRKISKQVESLMSARPDIFDLGDNKKSGHGLFGDFFSRVTK